MSWLRLDFDDALLAEARVADIRRRAWTAFEAAGRPAGWAVYVEHVSGDLHCRTRLLFSPAAAAFARRLGAVRGEAAGPDASLLAGDVPESIE